MLSPQGRRPGPLPASSPSDPQAWGDTKRCESRSPPTPRPETFSRESRTQSIRDPPALIRRGSQGGADSPTWGPPPRAIPQPQIRNSHGRGPSRVISSLSSSLRWWPQNEGGRWTGLGEGGNPRLPCPLPSGVTCVCPAGPWKPRRGLPSSAERCQDDVPNE